MFYEFRPMMFQNYHRARNYFCDNPNQLTDIENYITSIVNSCIRDNYEEIEHDYNEASYLNPFWANYPPEDRGRAPVGDQIPWIEVGEHAVGHRLSRLLSYNFDIEEIGLPSGADNRFVLCSDEISRITLGATNRAFVFLDIKSVGPRDNSDHTVISPYQVSGDGLWARPDENIINSPMNAVGVRVRRVFYPAMAPIYAFSNTCMAPAVHLFVKPIYSMLSDGHRGQPLESIVSACVPNGLLLTENPNYLERYPSLFYPGKDERGKDPRKIRVRVSFRILCQIDRWRVQEITGF